MVHGDVVGRAVRACGHRLARTVVDDPEPVVAVGRRALGERAVAEPPGRRVAAWAKYIWPSYGSVMSCVRRPPKTTVGTPPSISGCGSVVAPYQVTTLATGPAALALAPSTRVLMAILPVAGLLLPGDQQLASPPGDARLGDRAHPGTRRELEPDGSDSRCGGGRTARRGDAGRQRGRGDRKRSRCCCVPGAKLGGGHHRFPFGGRGDSRSVQSER